MSNAQPSPSLDELLDDIYIPDPTDPAHEREITLWDIEKDGEDISLAQKITYRVTALLEAEKLSEYQRGEAAGLKYGLVTLTETIRALQNQHNETIAKLHALQDEHKEEAE